jgi:hypothetical protein
LSFSLVFYTLTTIGFLLVLFCLLWFAFSYCSPTSYVFPAFPIVLLMSFILSRIFTRSSRIISQAFWVLDFKEEKKHAPIFRGIGTG